MLKRSIFTFIVLLLVQSCTTEKKHPLPSFVSNKKPDTHFFEQVIHKKNSAEVLFYFKFNYKRNEVSIYRPDSDHTDVGIQVNKRFSDDSLFLHLEVHYVENSEKTYPEIKQKKGKTGLYEPFYYSDEPKIDQCQCAHSGESFILIRDKDDYRYLTGFMEKEDAVKDLRYFIFDENPDEQYFFRLKTDEELFSYPKKEK